jgi:hypothetical protein
MHAAVVVAAVTLMVSSAGAKPVYKCEEKGVITYTDRPCGPGATAAELPDLIVTTPPSRSEQDLAQEHDARLARDRAERDAADAEWLEQHEREQAQAREARKKPAPKARKRPRK